MEKHPKILFMLRENSRAFQVSLLKWLAEKYKPLKVDEKIQMWCKSLEKTDPEFVQEATRNSFSRGIATIDCKS